MGLFDKENKGGILSKLQRATGELFASGGTESGNDQKIGKPKFCTGLNSSRYRPPTRMEKLKKCSSICCQSIFRGIFIASLPVSYSTKMIRMTTSRA